MNEEMTIKMFNKCIPDIILLEQGKRIDEKQVTDMCDFIDSRYDCADFRLCSILRVLYSYSHLLSEKTLNRIRDTVLSFKYWMDEPGEDSMCYWSENHQIIFHVCEYLAGQYYPDDIFTNSGLTGTQHMRKARPKIENWLSNRWKYGFSEWHSNVYYEEDIAPLANLIDFAGEVRLAQKGKIIMDLMLLDMAMHSYQGLFAAASGRCYEEQKTDPLKQFTLPITEKMGNFNNLKEFDYSALAANFLLCKNYEIPGVIKEIARDKGEVIIKDSMGLNLPEVLEEFPDSDDFATTGMYFWAMEAFTNPESINITLDIFNGWNLKNNEFLKDLKLVNCWILRRLNLLPALIRWLNPATQGIAIQRANTYTYKTNNYMLSTAQKHHPGTFGDQQHIWQATLSKDISVFTTHPASQLFDDEARNFSPSYWVGTGRMPHSVQEKNIHLSIYIIEGKKGFMERTLNMFTHAYFPYNKFEQVVHIKQRYIFAEQNGTYIALIGRNELSYQDDNRCDLIQYGTETYWICELGRRERWGSLQKFIENIQNRVIIYQGRTLSYQDENGRQYRLEYNKDFSIDGQIVDTEYPRFDTPYVKAARKPEELMITFAGKSLYLDFEKNIRKMQE